MTKTKKQLLNTVILNGISYQDYKNILIQQVQNFNPGTASQEEINHLENRKLNLHRTSRLDKHFNLSEESIRVLKQMKKKQIWMVLSETWCGDSAQNLPVIAAFEKHSELIEMKILFRDEHPGIMDLYIEDGVKRSIPKLVAFDKFGNELFQWGPRPHEAKLLFEKAITEGIEKDKRSKELHLWYGRNRGINTEKEISQLILFSSYWNNQLS